MSGYCLSEEAEQDLIEIYLTGLERWGEAQADLYGANLHETFALLAAHPQVGAAREVLGQGSRCSRKGRI